MARKGRARLVAGRTENFGGVKRSASHTQTFLFLINLSVNDYEGEGNEQGTRDDTQHIAISLSQPPRSRPSIERALWH